MNWKENVAEYFSFSRRDRIAILVITGLMAAVFLSPHFFNSGASQSHPIADTTWISALKNLEIRETSTNNRSFSANNQYETASYMYDRPHNSYYAPLKYELFSFDPNTLSADGWRKLGIRDKTIRTIQNYLSKGGRFRKQDDVKKIYGLAPGEYDRIAPYINVKGNSLPERKSSFQADENKTVRTITPRYSTIDINTADTTAFISLPGIGSKLSTRIVTFREKLGGFYSVDQLAETYGLPDSTFQKIRQYLKLENATIKKININTATVDELKAHPYIKYSLANPIVAFRNEHGLFSKLDDLMKVMVVTEEIYNKIAPYLTTQ